jgi:hypothetical protein
MSTPTGVPTFIIIYINYQFFLVGNTTIVAPPEDQRHLNAVYSMPSSEFEDGS